MHSDHLPTHKLMLYVCTFGFAICRARCSFGSVFLAFRHDPIKMCFPGLICMNVRSSPWQLCEAMLDTDSTITTALHLLLHTLVVVVLQLF